MATIFPQMPSLSQASLAGPSQMVNAVTNARRLELETKQFEMERLKEAFGVLKAMSPEMRNAATPFFNERVSALIGFPVDISTNMEAFEMGITQLDQLGRLNLPPLDRQQRANEIIAATARFVSPFDENAMQLLAQKGVVARFPFKSVPPGATEQEDALLQQIGERVGSLKEELIGDPDKPQLTDFEAGRQARDRVASEGLFRRLDEVRANREGLDAESAAALDIRREQENQLAGILAIPDAGKQAELFSLLVADLASLPPGSADQAKAMATTRMLQLFRKGSNLTNQEAVELRGLKQFLGAAEKETFIDELEASLIAKRKAEIDKMGQQANVYAAQANNLQSRTNFIDKQLELFPETKMLEMKALQASIDATQAKTKRTEAEVGQVQANTERLINMANQATVRTDLLEAERERVGVEIRKGEQLLAQQAITNPLEVERTKAEIEIAKLNAQTIEQALEFKKTGNPILLDQMRLMNEQMKAKTEEYRQRGLKLSRDFGKASTALEASREALVDKRRLEISQKTNTASAINEFFALPESQQTKKRAAEIAARYPIGTVSAADLTNAAKKGQLDINVNTGLQKKNIATLQDQRIAIEQTVPLLDNLTTVGRSNPQIFGVAGGVRDAFLAGARQILGLQNILGAVSPEVALSEISIEKDAQGKVRGLVATALDPSAPDFDVVHDILVFQVARSLDENGRLSVDDVERAEAIVGDRNFLTDQATFLQKMISLRRTLVQKHDIVSGILKQGQTAQSGTVDDLIQNILAEEFGGK